MTQRHKAICLWWHGLTVAQIANQINTTPDAVSKLLFAKVRK